MFFWWCALVAPWMCRALRRGKKGKNAQTANPNFSACTLSGADGEKPLDELGAILAESPVDPIAATPGLKVVRGHVAVQRRLEFCGRRIA